MVAIYFRKNVIDLKNPEMLKFISQNGRTLSLKKQTNQSEKNIFKINKNNDYIFGSFGTRQAELAMNIRFNSKEHHLV